MKKVIYLFSAALIALSFASCNKENKPDDKRDQPKAEAPTADFEYKVEGLNVTFTDKSKNATSYKWEFGDEETSKEASPKHTYASAGTYTVKLTVANADGATANKSASITVAGQPKAYFSYAAQTDRAGNFGLTIDFDATSSENAESIEFDFGDGEKGTEFKTSHTYAAYDTYKVKATVTNATGDKNTYEADVEVIAYNELLQGGEMEEEDAKYWSFIHTYVFPAGDYSTPGDEVSWEPYFGYTEDKPSKGHNGCLRLSSENQIHDQANNVKLYQAIEVEEGDYLEISAQMKWTAPFNDSGLLWFGIAYSEDEIGADGTSVVEMFNYWEPNWDNMGANSVLSIDGGFEANAAYIADNEARGIGYSNAGEAVAHCWAQKSGTAYFYVDLRSVWGTCFGPGHDMFLDCLSVKVVPAPEE